MVDIPGAPGTLSCTGEGAADENCWNQIAIPWQLEVWPESHWPGFALRQTDVLSSYVA